MDILPDAFAFADEGHATPTSVAQMECQSACAYLLQRAHADVDIDDEGDGHAATAPPAAPQRETARLHRDRHVAYLLRALDALPASYISLDASRTWIVYWVLHSLDLLGVRPVEQFPRIIAFLSRCQCASGGYGGGPGQLPHTAATYAAVLALLVISTPEALASINRRGLISFYRSLKDPASGAFRVQPGGEMDVRGTYTVLAVGSLLRLLDADAAPDLVSGTAEFLLSCQTYEGGFAGEPHCEAHGGYTFCSVGGLVVLGALHRCRVADLQRWLAQRQMALEGGFQGRTNKLVDACYSFWQGACFLSLPSEAPLQRQPLCEPPPAGAVDDRLLLDRRKLQLYTLLCSQDATGGMCDKPGKSRDYYHTCYSLSGLSVAQQSVEGAVLPEFVLGPAEHNGLLPTHPVYNIVRERVVAAAEYFGSRPI